MVWSEGRVVFRTPSAKGAAKMSLSLTLAVGMGCQWDPVAEGAGEISSLLWLLK